MRLVLSVFNALCSEVKSPAMAPSVLMAVLTPTSWFCRADDRDLRRGGVSLQNLVEIEAGEIRQGHRGVLAICTRPRVRARGVPKLRLPTGV